MKESSNWLLHDHRMYEEILLACKNAARQDDWEQADKKCHDLVALLKGHFLMEEQILFPFYEELVGSLSSPTQHLRNEHDRIRQLLKTLALAVAESAIESFEDALAPLEKVLGEHHEKEEDIFLPMAGHALLEKREEVMNRLKRFDWRSSMKSWSI